ncbi:MAG TPA: M48 family metallopeptidase [Vicinamibacterales bacterium]|nr:M48 family metallopeptidase [Vicinamibacterales bacterium]
MANEDKSARYHRLRRRASVLSAALGALFLFVLLVSGWSASLRDASASLARGTFLGTLAVYVIAVAVLHDLLQLPLAFYEGVTLERRYDLSTESTARWWKDHLKGWGIGTAFGLAAAAGLWSLIRWDPERWWLAAALLFSLVIVALAQLGPVLLLPLFYEVKPLARATLAARLAALAERAGAPVLGTFEWRISDRTKKANAALAGLGRTRRILLSDTLLAGYSDDEIEVILAHELAHHVHHDIWRAIVFETALIALGFYISDAVLTAWAGSFGVAGKGDIAALPLLLLTMGMVSLVLMPLRNALSRSHERRADRYALKMTRNLEAFVTAMKRLSAQNLAEEEPSKLVETLFHSHPSISARISAARSFKLDPA